MTHTCPVCGYAGLSEAPRSISGGASYEICVSCGFQFGVTDEDRGISEEQWREQWITNGMRWSGHDTPAPEGWNPSEQLKKIGVNILN